jgi:hypothetical protein
MPALEVLAQALAREGYAPLRPAEGTPPLEDFRFLGAKEHWGSISAVGLFPADGLPLEALDRRVADLHALAQALAPMAGHLTVQPLVGEGTEVKLGVFAVALAVFEGGAPPEAVDHLRRSRGGGLRDRVKAFAWAVDGPLGKCWDHRGLPFAVAPGRKWVERILRS